MPRPGGPPGALAAGALLAPRRAGRRRGPVPPAGARPGVGERRVGALGSAERFGALARRLGHQAPALTRATAKQAMPSRRPSAPSPSARLPFTVTGAPDGLARGGASISSRRGASFGASSTTVQSTLPGSQPGGAHVGDRSAQQLEAVGPGQRGVGVGEVLADVAEPGGAEQRVGDGVGDDVGVAVAGEAALALEHARRRAPAAGPGRR